MSTNQTNRNVAFGGGMDHGFNKGPIHNRKEVVWQKKTDKLVKRLIRIKSMTRI